MELVIKIPEHYYENNIKKELPIYLSEDNIVAILPKGHGRLIDAKNVYKKFYNRSMAKIGKEILDETPTIIEADKAESEDKK